MIKVQICDKLKGNHIYEVSGSEVQSVFIAENDLTEQWIRKSKFDQLSKINAGLVKDFNNMLQVNSRLTAQLQKAYGCND